MPPAITAHAGYSAAQPAARRAAIVMVLLVCGLSMIVGCEPYRVEYVRVPEFYNNAVQGGMPNEVILPDGTRRVYVQGKSRSNLRRRANSEDTPFRIREEDEQGNVRIRALLPEHVLANTFSCISNQEYQLLWDQMLSEQTKLSFEEHGGYEQWLDIVQRNRRDMLTFLNRMMLEFPRSGLIVEKVGDGVIQLRFTPQIARDFRYRRLRIINEGFGLKLLSIQ